MVVWGEFGRTPKINNNAGRDHWPQVSFTMLAGGGMRTGQVIGATSPYAELARDRPVTYQSVFATLYRNLGIDPNSLVTDRNNRQMFMLDEHPRVIHEVV